MANSNRKSDGKASRASEVCAFGITGGEDGEDQLECDEELHQKAVSYRDLSVHLQKRLSWLASKNVCNVFRKGRTVDWYLCDAKGASGACRRDEVQDPSASYGSQTLSHHIEQRLGQAQLSGHHHGRRDGWVDVSAADVAETLHHGGDAQAKAQRDEDQVGRRRLLLPRLPSDGGAQAEKDKDEGGQVFS